MSHLKGAIARLRSMFGVRSTEARMEEEFRFHVEMETRRLIDREGLTESEARRRALVSFGGLDAHREQMRDGRGARWFDDLAADARYAVRAMRRSPAFAIAVAITLGVGIGVNGIVFGYVNSLLFRPVVAVEPQQLVSMFNVDSKTKQPVEIAYEDYLDFRDKGGVFDGLAGMTGVPLNLSVPWGSGTADMVWGEMVTENFFSVLRLQPALGRLFTASDAPQGANPFAVLSYDCWMKRFAGDRSVIGKRIRINGTGFTVVAIAPEGFKGLRTFGFWPEIWVPVGMHNVVAPRSTGLFQGRGGGWMMTVGRMHPGSTRATTELAAQRFAKQLAQMYPATNANADVLLLPAAVGFDNPAFVKPGIILLASALGVFASLVTLAIICANLANLQLARAAARAHEIAIRLSLGCSRGRLARQMLVESAILAAPGLVIAAVLLRSSPTLEAYMVPHLQFRVGFDASADVRVVAFTAAVAILAIVLLGIAPALRSTRVPSLSTLIGAPRSSAGRRQRVRSALVVSQLSLSVVLLTGASLFVRSLLVARAMDVGFDERDRALMSVNVGLQGYDEARGRRFYDDVLMRVRAMPSVAAAAWTFPVPFDTYGRGVSLYVDGTRSSSSDGTIRFESSVASEGFIEATGLALQEGREFNTGDSAAAPQVMMVSRSLANRLWPGKNPIGQRARRGSSTGPEITVVGVVGNAKFESLGPSTEDRVYLPLRQQYRDWQTLVVHTRGDPRTAIPSIRTSLANADPALPVFGAMTMEEAVQSGLATSRTAASIAGFFGILALLISSVGLYAVVASGVSERTREIGVRMALGSTPRDVMSFVMRGGARLGLIGLIVGLVGAAVIARLMGSLLYGLSPNDPITFSLVPLVLAVVVLVAAYIPARRAVKLDPVAALRSD